MTEGGKTAAESSTNEPISVVNEADDTGWIEVRHKKKSENQFGDRQQSTRVPAHT